MKIRQGFVSNSSSSSFAIVVLEDAHQRVYNSLTADQRKVIDHMMSKPTKLGNLTVRCGIDLCDQGGYGTMSYLIEDEGLEEPYDSWEQYCKGFKGSEKVSVREDC